MVISFGMCVGKSLTGITRVRSAARVSEEPPLFAVFLEFEDISSTAQ